MIIIKQSVIIRRLLPCIYRLFEPIDKIFEQHGQWAVITSAWDGQHRQNSKHYTGEALDLRSKNLPPELKEAVLEELRTSIGPDYDVLLEYRDGDNEHYHIEFDPKGG